MFPFSLEMLYLITLMNRGEIELLETLFGILQVKYATPLGYAAIRSPTKPFR